MDGEVFVGHHCPKCGTTIGMSVGAGAPLRCPGCGGPMEASPGGPPIRVLANVECKSCGSKCGMMIVVGSETLKCPSCGKPI